MKVIPIPALKDNYIWLIIRGRDAICVDPGESDCVLAYIAEHQLILDSIFLTHHHTDHLGGVPGLLKVHPACPVYAPNDLRIQQATHQVTEGDNVARLGFNFQVLAIPGHTVSHISYYEPQQHWLFCGDTLFSAGCGRVFDGTLETLYDSLMRLKQLPDETFIYCAHEYTQHNLQFAALVEPTNKAIIQQMGLSNACSLPSTIEKEKSINPFFRTKEKDVVQYALKKGSKDSSSFNIFKQLRKDKDEF